ncbi:MAG: hypothetical protein WDN26_03930 [Chitinophagaceae bacterium]
MKKQLMLLISIACFLTAHVFAQNGNTGIGTTQPGSKLTVNGSFAGTYSNITAITYSMTAADYYLAWNGASNGTITLPAYNTAVSPATTIKGRMYYIKNTSTSSALTVAANGTEKLDNQTGAAVASISLPSGYIAIIISTGVLSATGTTWEVALINSSAVASSGITSLRVYMNSYSISGSGGSTQLSIQGTSFNTITGSTIGANNITLPAGTYRVTLTNSGDFITGAGQGASLLSTLFVSGSAYQKLAASEITGPFISVPASNSGSAILTLAASGTIHFINSCSASGGFNGGAGSANTAASVEKLQ